jgi:hypothetical protein
LQNFVIVITILLVYNLILWYWTNISAHEYQSTLNTSMVASFSTEKAE